MKQNDEIANGLCNQHMSNMKVCFGKTTAGHNEVNAPFYLANSLIPVLADKFRVEVLSELL